MPDQALTHRKLTWFKLAWLTTGVLGALYVVVIEPIELERSVASSKSAGLASMVQRRSIASSLSRAIRGGTRREGYVSGISGGIPMAAMLIPPAGDADQRKLVRTSSLDLIVISPAQACAQVREIAERLGGWLETSEVSRQVGTPYASSTIRVPAARADEARAEIRKLATRIESEKTDAKDITKEYVDLDARLRNLRAEEEQYLGIMRRATTVKYTLEVSEKLNEVRGQIEEQQAEFNALAKQVETVEIAVGLRADADAQVFGLHWRPLYELKIAARQGLDGIAYYVSSIVGFAFLLPAIFLWAVTVVLGAAFGWRTLKWVGRVFFGYPRAVAG